MRPPLALRPWLLVSAVACACATASRERGGAGLFDNVQTYPAPATSRCAALAKGGPRARSCEEATYLAQLYVRRLATSDTVCLEGGFGEPPSGACLARAMVADTGQDKVMLEVREAKPSSRWFNREATQFWFEEGALVDLYLAEHGY